MTWNDAAQLPNDSTTRLLAIEVRGKKLVVEGAYDHSWSGRRWIFTNKQIPQNEATVVKWADMPAFPEL